VQGSDVLVVRSSVPRVPPVYTTADFAPNAAVLTVTPVPAASANFQYAAVSDCTKSVIFQAGMAAGATTVALNAGLPGVGFSAGAVVAPLTTTVYYIGTGSDGDASLWRIEQVSNVPDFAQPEELVPDVENMQVLYGIDPTGTQTAAAYVTGDLLGAANVVSIQVALLVASAPATKPVVPVAAYTLLGTAVPVPADNRVRQVFNATINLRNAVN
jgi:type IV pilus assembly protein PilW